MKNEYVIVLLQQASTDLKRYLATIKSFKVKSAKIWRKEARSNLKEVNLAIKTLKNNVQKR